MPLMKVALPLYSQFKELKKAAIRKKLERRVQLYQQEKAAKEELRSLNFELFGELRSALPADLKSVEYEGFQVTAMEGSARRALSVKKLLTDLFKCPHCKKELVVPAKVVEKAYVTGKTPSPTISVRLIKGDGSSDEDEGEEE